MIPLLLALILASVTTDLRAVAVAEPLALLTAPLRSEDPAAGGILAAHAFSIRDDAAACFATIAVATRVHVTADVEPRIASDFPRYFLNEIPVGATLGRVASPQQHPASIKPIRLQVCCDTVLSTADVRVIVHTQSDPSNVAVTLEIDGPAYWTYSELPLNGEHSPATFQVRYPQLPAGAYVITVILWRHELKTYEAGRAVGRVRIGPLED